MKTAEKYFMVIPFDSKNGPFNINSFSNIGMDIFISTMEWEAKNKAKEYAKKFDKLFCVVEVKNVFGNNLISCPCCGGDMSIKKLAEHSYLFTCKSCGLNKQTNSDRQTAIFRWNFLRKSNDYVDDHYGWRSCPICGYKYTCSNVNLDDTNNLLCRCCSCSTKDCKTEEEAEKLWNRRIK